MLRQDITDYTELKAFFKENGIRESGKYRMAFVNVRSDVFAEGMTNPVLRVFEKISPWYTYEYPGEYVLLLKESDTGKTIRLLQELTRVHEAEITAGMGMIKELSHISQSWQEARLPWVMEPPRKPMVTGSPLPAFLNTCWIAYQLPRLTIPFSKSIMLRPPKSLPP